MTDKYLRSLNFNSRPQKKRGSVDSVMNTKLDKKLKNDSTHHRQIKKQRQRQRQKQKDKDMGQLTIDLYPKNYTKLSLYRNNFTHRIEQSQFQSSQNQSQSLGNLCQLREEVEQLRMENQSLREEIRSLRAGEEEAKFNISSLKKQLLNEQQKYHKLSTQYQLLTTKTQKYSQKIKQLFQLLIKQKRRNLPEDYDQIPPSSSHHTNSLAPPPASALPLKRIALSPSNLAICNSLNLRKFQQEGFRDFYNSKNSVYGQGLGQGQGQGQGQGEREEQYFRRGRGWGNQDYEDGNVETFGGKF